MIEDLKQTVKQFHIDFSYIDSLINFISNQYHSSNYKKEYDQKITKFSEIEVDKIEYNKEKNYKTLREVVKNKSFECTYFGEEVLLTYNNDIYFKKNNDNKRIIYLSKTDFTRLLLFVFKDFIITFCQNTRIHTKTVKNFNVKAFGVIFPAIIITIIALLYYQQTRTYVAMLVILYYSICILFKIYFLNIGSIFRTDFIKDNNFVYNKNILTNTIERNNLFLPKYTILIPMFKENEKIVKQIISAVQKIIYPKDLLDVKLVLEEDDLQTIDILQKINLQDYIVPIFVPYFEPRTKPKACNVASLFAEGKYVVIFDAEDIPNETQLLHSVRMFNKHSSYQILQGNLRFYNYNQNLLTEFFNIEYTVWFKIALQAFSSYGITIPLGGTTNHIKYSFLETLNFWDSYNVTEDLELSVSTLSFCLKTPITHLNNDTREWCVIKIKDFIKQRTRWLKGYLLTYLIHFFEKRKTFKQKIFFHIIIGYSTLSFLLLPILLIALCLAKINKIFITILIFTNFLYYITYIFLYISLLKNYDIILTKRRIFVLLLYPFYFILHTISAYVAVYCICKNPFYWTKTKHNI